MFLGLVMFETLDEHGQRNSYFMSPGRNGKFLVVDDLKDVDRSDSADVDFGPLRIYADTHGIGFRSTASRMGGEAFQKHGDRMSVTISHSAVPLPSGHAGYYGLLLPGSFTGKVSLSIKVAGKEQVDDESCRVFLTDTRQIYVASRFEVAGHQRARPDIRVTADLRRSTRAPAGMRSSTFDEQLGGFIDGLKEGPIAGLIRAIIEASLPTRVRYSCVIPARTSRSPAESLMHWSVAGSACGSTKQRSVSATLSSTRSSAASCLRTI